MRTTSTLRVSFFAIDRALACILGELRDQHADQTPVFRRVEDVRESLDEIYVAIRVAERGARP